MDILKILEESYEKLYVEDVEFFQTELATNGEYSKSYRRQCEEIIARWLNWKKTGSMIPDDDTAADKGNGNKAKKKKAVPEGLVVGISDLAPQANNPIVASLTPEQMIFQDIKTIRDVPAYKTNFKKFVSKRPEIDAAFVDAHYSFFQEWELNAIVSVKQLGEPFLEKYFGALDRDKIARYQLFSESFFMKHFSQMDASIVLEHGKNEWRKKENRSKQLDVFLRLKGVKI